MVLVSTEPGFEASIAVAERLDRDRGRLAPSGGSVAVGGFAAYREQLSRLSRSDLSRAERIGLPIILIVLFLTFGSLWAAALPLAIALSSVVIGLGLSDLVARTTDVADFVTNTATMLGVALGVDYALFVLQRVREEARGGATLDGAISRSMATTGRAVAWSAAIVVLAESTMFLVDSRRFGRSRSA